MSLSNKKSTKIMLSCLNIIGQSEIRTVSLDKLNSLLSSVLMFILVVSGSCNLCLEEKLQRVRSEGKDKDQLLNKSSELLCVDINSNFS